MNFMVFEAQIKAQEGKNVLKPLLSLYMFVECTCQFFLALVSYFTCFIYCLLPLCHIPYGCLIAIGRAIYDTCNVFKY